MEDDLDVPINEIGDHDGQSLVEQLIEIQRCRTRKPRSFEWAKTLICLTPVSVNPDSDLKELRKTPVDIAKGDYVAVSYKCEDVSPHEESIATHSIVAENGIDQKPSKVRKGILDRVLKYMQSFDVPTFWIDKESINQSDPVEIENAMQSMDLVYRCSNHPLGILTTMVEQQNELDLLAALISGALTVQVHAKKKQDFTHQEIRQLIRLLDRLMQDSWWSRRWIFQEEYCSSRVTKRKMMTLLLPHKQGLSKDNWDKHSRTLEGEVLIKVAKLRTQATLFCLACLDADIPQKKRDQQMLNNILDKVKSYKIMHEHGEETKCTTFGHPMTIQILSDITDRAVTLPGDTLAILSNCSGYNVRLDRHKLETQHKTSLSLAILALFLLNGEIFWSKKRTSSDATMLEFLQTQTFDEFDPPVDTKQLTFMKKNRFVNVDLLEEGIRTTGHLWKIKTQIHTNTFRRRQPSHTDDDDDGDETLHQTFTWLITELRKRHYTHLASNIEQYLHDEVPTHMHQSKGLTQVLDDTATRLAGAIAAGTDVVVVQHDTGRSSWGIFVSEWDESAPTRPSLIFTASEPAEYDAIVEMPRSPDKYVSLSVYADRRRRKGSSLLRIKGWVNGLTFPGRVSERQVVFRWPAILEDELDSSPSSLDADTGDR